MIQFLRENGYPVDLKFTTPEPYEDKENDFIGYKCDILVDGNICDELIFNDPRARVYYSSGFLAACSWKDEKTKELGQQTNAELEQLNT